MLQEVGDPHFDIWLLGDSEPANWRAVLTGPFDPRHGTRHNVWTSVADVIQERVFRAARSRIDTTSLYIRNPIQDPAGKPQPKDSIWKATVEHQIMELQGLVNTHHPKLLFTFGAFSYEFARRTLGHKPQMRFDHWDTKGLGAAFRQAAENFDVQRTNVLPLLHHSIARGHFISAHDQYTQVDGGNYFDSVGNTIAKLLLQHHDAFDIWID